MNELNMMEKLRFVLMDISIIGIVSYLFYESLIAFFFLLPSIIVIYKSQNKKFIKKKQELLRAEFKDFCIVLSNNLKVGYSFENALKNSINESKELCKDNSKLLRELMIVINKVQINVPVEVAFMEFAKKTNIEEIVIFAEILSITKRSSGNVVEVIKNTLESITMKIELKREIGVIFASKKFEQKIMNIIPFVIICYVKLTSPGMMDVMYSTLLGRILMTVCLLIFIIALLLSEKIMDMEDYV